MPLKGFSSTATAILCKDFDVMELPVKKKNLAVTREYRSFEIFRHISLLKNELTRKQSLAYTLRCH